jgi:hypothetical protein
MRAWVTTMPEDYRVGPPRVARHKTELAIVETRLTVSWLNDRGSHR